MIQDGRNSEGVASDEARATAASQSNPSVSSTAGIANTIGDGNSQPDWFEVARGLSYAIMFQRSTRSEHVVGKDGRVRLGHVDLLGMYIVDDAAKEFCEMAGLPFSSIDVPNEHQAFYMFLTSRGWQHWLTEKQAIIEGAGPSPGKGKVNLKALAKAIEARSDKTGTGLAEGESAAPQGFAQTQSGAD